VGFQPWLLRSFNTIQEYNINNFGYLQSSIDTIYGRRACDALPSHVWPRFNQFNKYTSCVNQFEDGKASTSQPLHTYLIRWESERKWERERQREREREREGKDDEKEKEKRRNKGKEKKREDTEKSMHEPMNHQVAVLIKQIY